MRLIIIFTLLLTSFLHTNVSGQPTITTNTPIQTSFCAGGNLVVEYSTTGTFAPGCVFTAQLSDANGNFNSPVSVGSMPFNAGIIAGTIPSNTPFGVNYKVRVIASNPATIGTPSNDRLVITSTAVSATIVANPQGEVCEGETVSLFVTPNANYRWSTGETTQSIQVTTSGSYTVMVTNFLTGCQVTSAPKVVTVNPKPVVDFGPNFERCEGQTVTLDAGAGYVSYLWNDSSATQFLDVQASGIYLVQVKDVHGCIGTDTVVAIFHPNPEISLGTDTNICGSSFLLSSGQGFVSYIWNDGVSFNPNFEAQSSGTYYVSVTDTNSCSVIDTIELNIYPLPVINLGNDISSCGNSIRLDAGTGSIAYDWNSGMSSNRILNITETGTYTVKVTESHGCFNSDTIEVTIHAMPEVNLGSDVLLYTNDSLELEAGSGFVSYQWSTGDSTENIKLSGADYPLGPLYVHVTVTDNNGCGNTDQITVSIVPLKATDDYIVYPNPVRDILYLVTKKKVNKAIPVFQDMLGRAAYPDFKITSSGMEIYRAGMAAGTYDVYLENVDGFHSFGKVVVY